MGQFSKQMNIQNQIDIRKTGGFKSNVKERANLSPLISDKAEINVQRILTR